MLTIVWLQYTLRDTFGYQLMEQAERTTEKS